MKLLKKFLLFSVFCVAVCYATAQDSILVLQKSLPYKIVSFSVNNIGELFLINQDNQLIKIDNKGDSVGVYNEIGKYGILNSVNARNPWRTLLYYKDYSTIVLLDKYLNEVTKINLRLNNLFRTNAIDVAYDNNIWLFDEQDEKLKKIDEAGKILSETNDFRQLFNDAPSPKIIKDRDQYVYLYDPLKGLYVFDYYGSFKNRFDFLKWKNFEVFGQNIYGFDESYFYWYVKGTMNLKHYVLPAHKFLFSDIQIANNKLYFLEDGILRIYNFKQNGNN